ncbi:universal stress protein [Marinomonas flavescens]|uniref:universal stress protein n=1 Tax=Marinomonas flavescens TaxID=2529379 RepID=UPI001056C76F|nr:universal stress protein [Marinomonas flavescens]
MLPEVGKILYSTDLSKSSMKAFDQAVYIAKKTGADIYILHVVEKMSNDAKITLKTYVNDPESRREFLEDRVRFAKEKLGVVQNEFWERLSLEDQNVRQQIKSIQVVEAYPAESILKISQKLEVDLIVMGTHEKGVFQTFLGSVAKNVLSHSHIPMLIVPLPEL